MAGELIGIVNAKQAQTGIEGLGFAIPIDVAWTVAEDMIQYGYVTGKLKLGFEIEVHTESFKKASGYSVYTFPAGVYIVDAEESKFNNYDRIVSMNGKEIADIYDYYDVLDTLKSGATLTMVVNRLTVIGAHYSFKDVTVSVTVERTEAPQQNS
jgi:serine protease Do